MVESVKKAAVIFHDITVDDLRQFRLAVTNDIAHMTENWTKVKKAGEDWAKHSSFGHCMVKYVSYSSWIRPTVY